MHWWLVWLVIRKIEEYSKEQLDYTFFDWHLGFSATNNACLVDSDCVGKNCKLNLCGNLYSNY